VHVTPEDVNEESQSFKRIEPMKESEPIKFLKANKSVADDIFCSNSSLPSFQINNDLMNDSRNSESEG